MSPVDFTSRKHLLPSTDHELSVLAPLHHVRNHVHRLHKRYILLRISLPARHLSDNTEVHFTNHMYALAADLLEKYNLPFDAMLPLIDETARKVHELAPRDAQTGPAVRYDENVISNHLAMLVDSPALQEIYKLMSKSIHEHHQL